MGAERTQQAPFSRWHSMSYEDTDLYVKHAARALEGVGWGGGPSTLVCVCEWFRAGGHRHGAHAKVCPARRALPWASAPSSRGAHVGARPGRRQSPHNREWRGRSAPRFGRSGAAQQPLSRVVSGAAPHPCCARCLEPRGASSTPHAALALQGVSTTREEMRYNACASFKEHTTAFPSALFASEAGTWALKGLFPARG